MRHRRPSARVRTSLLLCAVALAALLPLFAAGPAAAEDTFVPTAVWPDPGLPGYSPIFMPQGVVVTPEASPTVLVVDKQNARVQRYNNRGQLVQSFGDTPGPGKLNFVNDMYGATGPMGITVDNSLNVYVADTAGHRVVMYSRFGQYLRTFGVPRSTWTGPGDMEMPVDVEVDSQYRVYVSDYVHSRVQVFDPLADPLEFPNYCVGVFPFSSPPAGLALDADGALWLTSVDENTIARYAVSTDSSGAVTASHDVTHTPDLLVPIGMEWSPYGEGTVFVADTYHNRVDQFDPVTGEKLASLQGAEDYALREPADVSVDTSETLYVADTGNDRVVKWVNRYASDSDPPIVTALIDPAWQRGPVQVSIVATDPQSHLNYILYGVNVSSPAATYTVPFWVADEGTTTVVFKAADNAGNVSDQRTMQLRIDNHAPESTTTASDSWTTSTDPVFISSVDSLSGVAETYYKKGTGAIATCTPSTPITFTPNASTQLQYWATDVAGNVEATKSIDVRIDTIAPTCYSDLVPGRIHRAEATVTLLPSDNISGVDVTFYSTDGSFPTVPYTGPFVITTEGVNTLKYYSIDNAGNVGGMMIEDVSVDGAPPITTSSIDTLWHSTDVTVSLSATDTFGVAGSWYRVGEGAVTSYTAPFLVTGEGQITVEFGSVDLQDNRETTKSAMVKLDKTPPSSWNEPVSGWHKTFVVYLHTSDALSGVDTHDIRYSIAGGELTTFGGGFQVTGEGTVTVDYFAIDHAGNKETTKSVNVMCDNTPPVTTTDATITSNVAHLFPTDGGSGVANTFYSIDSVDNTYPTISYNASQGIEIPFQGIVYLRWFSVDQAGNAESIHTVPLVYDTTPPTTQSNIQDGAWRAAPFHVTLTAEDDNSGWRDTYYRLNGGAVTTYPAETGFDLSTEGTVTVQYWSVDMLGNTESPNTRTVRIDGTLPSATSDFDGPSTWRKGDQMVTISASDTPSGLRDIWYRVNGSALATTTGTVPITTNGTNTLEYYATDVAGNRNTTRTATVKVDKQTPFTGSNIDGVRRKGNFTVTLYPSDGESGVSYTRYRIDTGATATYTAPFTVWSDGTTLIRFWSVDSVGNVESTKTATVELDNGAPNTAQTGADTLWHASDVTVTLTASDTLSPIQATYWVLDGGTLNMYSGPIVVSSEGSHTLEYFSVDDPGNREATETASVKIDKSGPYTTSNGDAAWHDGTFGLSLTATDTLSGLDRTYYRVNGGPTTTYTVPVTFTTQGSNNVEFWSTDALGNRETTRAATVYTDLTPPFSASNADAQWRKSPFLWSFDSTDTLSGVKTKYYRLNGGAITTYTAPVSISGQGVNSLQYWAVDDVGNAEAAKSANVKIDDGVPTTFSDIDAAWHSQAVTVTITPTDALSGVASTYYKIGTGGWVFYTGPFPISNEGSTTVSWYSIDAVGNVQPVASAVVKIERVAPVTTDDAPTGWVGEPVTVHLFPTDAVSGVGSTSYRVNGSGVSPGTSVVLSTDGTKTIEYWSTDVAGNVETTKTRTVYLDFSAPVTTSSIDGLWHTSTVTVSLSAVDTLSGPANTYYRIGTGGSYLPYGGPFAVGAQGQTEVFWYTVDAVGHAEAARSATVRIDRDAPSTGHDAPAGWVGSARTVQLSPTDGVSGVASTRYSVNGSDATSGTAVWVSAEGTNTVTFRSTDVAGNVESTKTATVLLDLSAPITDSSIDTAWHTSTVTVTLSAVDVLSGPTDTYRSVGGGPFTLYEAPFVVASPGETVVEWYSFDAAGNRETTRSATVRIDGTAPVTTSDAAVNYLNTAGQTIALTPGTDISGISATRWSMDSGPWTTGTAIPVPTALGTHTLRFYSIDNAGNQETLRSATFTVLQRIDHTYSLIYPHGAWAAHANGAYFGGTARQANSAATLNFAFTGPEVHIVGARRPDGGRVRVTLDSSETTTISFFNASTWSFQQRVWSATGLADTTHTVRVEWLNQKDAASTGYYVNLDAVDVAAGIVAFPDVTPPLTASNALASYRDTATVGLTANDADTVVTSTHYSLDAGAWTPGASVVTTAPGSHTLSFYSVDLAGNVETTRTVMFEVARRNDNLATQIVKTGTWTTRSHPGDFSSSSWYATTNGPAVYALFTGTSFTWVGSKSPQCGIAEVSLDGSVPVIVDLYDPAYLFQRSLWTTSGLAPGQHVVKIRSTGTKNLSATEARVYVDAFDVAGALVADTGVPTTSLVNTGEWWTPPYSFELTATDGGMGVSVTRYRLDGGATQTYSSPVVISAAGTHTVEYWSVDVAGNTESAHTSIVGVDDTDPVTSYLPPGGWSRFPVTVSLDRSDDLSGVRTTWYRIDGGQPETYTTAFDIADPGAHTLEYWSADNAGNVESARTATVSIDAADPVTTGYDDGSWHRGIVDFALTATDALSGVSATFYRLNADATATYTTAVPIGDDGANTIEYWSVDAAGNVESSTVTTVRIDNGDPDTSDDAPAGWSRSPVSVTLDPTDAHSGVAGTVYRLDSGAETTYSAPVAVLDEGVHTLLYHSTDGAGNVEDTETAIVRIDWTAPESSAIASSTWTVPGTTVTLQSTDTVSGVDAIVLRLDGSQPATYSSPIVIGEGGVHTVEFWAVDAAGNAEDEQSVTVYVDGEAPATSDDVRSSYLETATVSLTASDAVSGVAATFARLDEGEWADAGSVMTTGPGPHTVEYYSVDVAGNTETTRSSRFDVYRTVDDTDERILFSGAYSTHTNGVYHGGTARQISGAGTAYMSFTGTGIRIVATKRPDGGIMRVTLDSTATPAMVDLYNPSTWSFQQVVYSAEGLPYGPHTLKLEWTGTKNPASSSTVVNLDAIQLAGELSDDAQPPHTVLDAPDGWSNEPVTFVLSGSDAEGAVKGTYYIVDGGMPQTYGLPVTLSAPGQHSLEYWSVDLAENIEEHHLATISIDTSAPFTATDLQPGYDDTATISLTPTDTQSGPAATYWRADGGAWTTGTVAVIPGRGIHTLDYYSVDVAGNVETQRSSSVSVFGRFDHTDTRFVYDGAWGTHSNPAYSGGAVRQITATGTVYLNFTGSGVKVVAAKRPDAGIMRVTLDGGAPVNVDLYNPSTWLFQQRVYSLTGLANAPHTLKVEWTGSKNASATASTVNIDALDVAGDVSQYYLPADHTDPRLRYEGAWSAHNNTSHYGGSTSQISAAGTAYVNFTGSAIRLLAAKRPDAGIARITLDGGAPVTVDLYNPSTWQFQQRVYSVSGLSNGAHTLKFEWTGTKNAASSGTSVNLDGIEVAGDHPDGVAPVTTTNAQATYATNATITLTPTDASGISATRWRLDGGTWTTGTVVATSSIGAHTLDYYSIDNAGNFETQKTVAFNVSTRLDQIDPRIVFDGNWITHSHVAYFGGSLKHISATGTAYVTFSGTGITLVSTKRPDGGIMRVTLDTTAPVNVDLYNPSVWSFQQKVYTVSGLPNTTHTVKLEWTGTKNAAAIGTLVNLDAADVSGSATQYYLTADHTDPRVRFEGGWANHGNPAYHGGTVKQASSASTAYVNFTGTAVKLVATKRPDGGIMRVTLDNGAPALVDLYNPSVWSFKQRVWEIASLENTSHTIKIEWTGSKNASATGSSVNLDAVDVGGSHPDEVAPVTTNNAQSTYATNATITLSPTDASGIASTSWRIDNGAWQSGVVVATSAIGSHVLDYYSIDRAGNFETQKTVAFDVFRRIDDADTREVFDGQWDTHINPGYNSGTARQITATGTAYVSFTGTGIKLVSTKRPDGGIMRVTLDANAPVNVDLYNASTWQFQQRVYSIAGLANTAHTLKVEWTGTKNPAANSTTVNFDAIEVAGDANQYYLRHEETDDRILFDGTWVNHPHPGYSASGSKQTETTSAAYVDFNGTGAKLIATKRPDGGIMRVTLDGTAVTNVDLYNASTWQFKQAVWSVSGLSNGSHTLKIEWTGTKNPSATATSVNLDAIDVAGTLSAAPDIVPPATTSNAIESYAGTATITLSASDSMSGVQATYWRLDGGPWQTGTLVTASQIGAHILDFYSEDKSGNRETTNTVSFHVLLRVDEEDPNVLFGPGWSETTHTGFYGGTSRTLNATASVTVTFTGDAVKIISTKRPDAGMLRVSIDGGEPVDVDLYNASVWVFQQRVWSLSLAPGQHVLTAEWSGTKNAASSGTYVNIDAFEVEGSVP